jgi:uncharacterized protein YbcV (DUF1398 family)
MAFMQRYDVGAPRAQNRIEPAKEADMDARLKSLVETYLDASEQGTLSFPEIVGRLMEAGFESYAIDFRRGTATYYLPDGDSLQVAAHKRDAPIAAAFDDAAVTAAIREAQANGPGYTYKGFCEKVMRAGCAGYIVSFRGRRAVYFGRTAEIHVELFPN